MPGLELDPSGWQNFLAEDEANQANNPEAQPGFFQGVVKGTATGLGRAATNVNDLLLTATDLIYPMSDEERGQQEGIRRTLTDLFTPAEHTVGTAGRVLGGVTESVAPLLVPIAGVPLTVGSNTLATGKHLVEQGVDAGTAGGVAAVEGAANYAGLKIPILGKTLAQRVASGVVGNTAFGAGTAEAEHQILAQRGYDQLAENYSPLDGEARAVDAISGAVFGSLFHVTAPSTRAATATINNAKHFQVDTAPGGIKDVNGSAAHQEALDAALDQSLKGEPVAVPQSILEQSFTPRPPREVPIPPELKELDANRLARVEFPRDQVTLEEEDRGRFLTVRTPNGFTEAKVKGGEYLQIVNTETTGGAKSRGEGTARINRLLDIAAERGLTFASDTKVSPEAARFYDRLAAEGFNVIRNAAKPDGEGHLISEDGKPIFEVHPKESAYSPPNGEAAGQQPSGTGPGVRADQNVAPTRPGEPGSAGVPGAGGHAVRSIRAFRGGLGELTAGTFGRRAVKGPTTQPSSALGVRFHRSAEHAAEFGHVSEHQVAFKNAKRITGADFPQFRTAQEYRDFADQLRAQGHDALIVSSHHKGGPVDFFALEPHTVEGLVKPAAGKVVDPDVAAATSMLAERDLKIPTGAIDADGNPVTRSGREVMAQAAADVAQAENDAKGFAAAVSCFLMRGPDAR